MWLVGGMPHRLGRDHTQTARLKTGQTGCTQCCFFFLLAIFGFQFSVSAGICLALAHMINPRTWRGHVVEKRRSNGSPKRLGQEMQLMNCLLASMDRGMGLVAMVPERGAETGLPGQVAGFNGFRQRS